MQWKHGNLRGYPRYNYQVLQKRVEREWEVKEAIVTVKERQWGLVWLGVGALHRMGIGFVISILATLVAGFMEVKRKNAALAHGLIDHPHSTIPISVFWLVPQYSLYGVAEAFMSNGHLKFFYD
ncbi:protein NRT1/ PTR FAMILY 3.1-like [Corylus avellana]|uniref:protein NRT1/ PTR FAMILY 3.1-like n=1 Tax=Corylus avellana TaxID=13451 RepID=UPI00286B6FEC|nr:protein NRT1/ PTR FAMILY 3.1-like [Corylus avellana]